MADQGCSDTVMRDYRKGNWTPAETMILIEAKKMDEERRMKRSEETEGRSKPTELRWKWVEDYCWRKGCHRSQNQCNDKWDNLMRDYKKVRDFERKIAEKGEGNEGSYWKISNVERKEKNLPSNLSSLIYEALVDVAEKKGSSSSSSALKMLPPLLHHHHILAPMLPTLYQPPPPQPPLQSQPLLLHPPPPPPPLPTTTTTTTLPYSQAIPTKSESTDSDTSEHSESPAKRRKRGEGGGGEEASGSNTSNSEVANAISKSASIIAKALQASEEKEERRHKELLNLHERRLRIEESKTEMNRQGFNGLVDAINKLANSILALASHKNHD